MKIVIMAAGGVGGYYGARLAAAGEDVHFVARGAHLAALRADGLRLTSENGDLQLQSVAATDDPREVGAADIVLIAVKQYDTEEAARLIAPVIGTGTAVIPLQNGIDPAQRLQAILGGAHIMGGTAFITGAAIVSPGVFTHTGSRARLVFGAFDRSVNALSTRFLAACKNASIDAVLSHDIVRDMWTKFALLSAFSGASCMLRSTAGAIMSDPTSRSLLGDAIAEAAAVAGARGIDLGADFVARHRDYYGSAAPQTKSSMLMDLEAGRRLELEWLSGAVVQFGRELNVSTPIHQAIYAALKPYADGQGRQAS